MWMEVLLSYQKLNKMSLQKAVRLLEDCFRLLFSYWWCRCQIILLGDKKRWTLERSGYCMMWCVLRWVKPYSLLSLIIEVPRRLVGWKMTDSGDWWLEAIFQAKGYSFLKLLVTPVGIIIAFRWQILCLLPTSNSWTVALSLQNQLSVYMALILAINRKCF